MGKMMLCIIPMQPLIAAACWLIIGASSQVPVPQKICVSELEIARSAGVEVARLRVDGEARTFSIDKGSKWNDGEITLFSSEEPADEYRPARNFWSVVASIQAGRITNVRVSFDGEDAHGYVGYSQSYERQLP